MLITRGGICAISVFSLLLGLASSCSGNPSGPGTTSEAGSGDTGAAEAGEGGASGGTTSSPGGRAAGGMVWVGLGGIVGAGGENPEPTCARAVAKAEFVPANFLFVIDSSGSMNCNPPDGDAALAQRCARYPTKEDPTRPSKWEVTKAALVTALDALAGKPHVRAGISLFPRVTECGVDAEPSVPVSPLDEEQIETIATALDAVEPDGETPLAGATILSYAHLASRLRAGTLSGNSFVVLLTDGAETCAPDVLEPLVEKDVPNARGFDIRTFVIGAPGSEGARALLSTVAWEGGTAAQEECSHDPTGTDGDCHLDMTTSTDFAAELGEALSAIAATEALECEIAVPENPDGGGVDLKRVNVTFEPEGAEAEEEIGQDVRPCAEANGWQYSEDFTKIVLCGDACAGVRTRSGKLSVVLGCPTIQVR